MPWCAGRILLSGPFGIRAGDEIAGPILPLDGDSGDHAVFRRLDPPSSSPWKYRRGYELRTEPEIASGPIWITPSIVPDSGRHGLELDVQWVEFGPDEDKPLSLRMIELLRLEFPVSWGEIHTWGFRDDVSAQPRATVGLLGEGRRFIELKRLTPADQEENEAQATHLTLSHLLFRTSRSGRRNIWTGNCRNARDAFRSHRSGAFQFAWRAAHAREASQRQDAGRPGLPAQPGEHPLPGFAGGAGPRSGGQQPGQLCRPICSLIPDDEAVIALTNAMSEEGYYVKHVIENPPRSGRRANELQRYWDIKGRRYVGVYPVEFHIILTGEEVHGGDIRPDRGAHAGPDRGEGRLHRRRDGAESPGRVQAASRPDGGHAGTSELRG